MSEHKIDIKYLLGIDGGGTKTEFLLTDINKNEINRVILGASNPVNTGIENTKSILCKGISQTCAKINYAEISVFAGIAGAGSESTKLTISKFLSGFGFGAYANGCDTENAVRAALNGENGVAVIMGTGIIAYTCLNGKLHRTGGWGYMIDKGGSGFCFGSDALNAAFEAVDGRGGSKLILELCENRLKKKLPYAVAEIYGGGASYIASFAPVIFEAYEKGDKKAEEIISRNTYEAARIIRTAAEFLNGEKGRTVICGGLCRRKDVILPFLNKHLGNDISPEFLDTATVNGALSLAKDNIRR